MNKGKENRVKIWAGDILDTSLDALDGESFIEAIAGGLAEKLGLTLAGLKDCFISTFIFISNRKVFIGQLKYKYATDCFLCICQ